MYRVLAGSGQFHGCTWMADSWALTKAQQAQTSDVSVLTFTSESPSQALPVCGIGCAAVPGTVCPQERENRGAWGGAQFWALQKGWTPQLGLPPPAGRRKWDKPNCQRWRASSPLGPTQLLRPAPLGFSRQRRSQSLDLLVGTLGPASCSDPGGPGQNGDMRSAHLRKSAVGFPRLRATLPCPCAGAC